MSRIDVAARSLTLKVVYYGAAACGKTTNLRTLHEIVDPAGNVEMRSLDTEGDRTLFFDLLPIEMPDVCGMALKIRLFTVPGQVHYNATRRIVLQGVDAVIFVADSSGARMDANCESLKSLHANLVANRIAPGDVPVVLQANKRDVPGAVPIGDLRSRLRIDALGDHARSVLPDVIAAEAPAGVGVFESFETALRAAAGRVHRHQALDRLGITRDQFAHAVREGLSPLRSRARSRLATAAATPCAPPPAIVPDEQVEASVGMEELLAESVVRALDLAEALGDQSAVATSLGRRVHELETINELSRVLAICTSEEQVARALVVAASAALPRGAGSFLAPDSTGSLAELAVAGLPRDPLLSIGTPSLAWIVCRASRPVAWPCLENDLLLGDDAAASRFVPHCSGAAAPVRMPSGAAGLLVAYGADPDARATVDTTRFLVAVAAQGSLALQNADRHAQLVAHRGRLEVEVAARTGELRLAHDELLAASHLKDRILSSVNHELRTPVTKLLAAAQVLDRVKPGTMPPPAFVATVVQQGRHLASLLDQALSARVLLSSSDDAAEEGASTDLARTVEAVAFACQERAAARQVRLEVDAPRTGRRAIGEPSTVSLVLAQLVDNGVKFTRRGTCVKVAMREAGDRLRVVVSDDGPGVPKADRDRIFAEFDQGSGDPLVAKPSGLGLGLAIARRLARRLGGDVGVDPPRAGEGATFWLELPARDGAVGDRADRPPGEPGLALAAGGAADRDSRPGG